MATALLIADTRSDLSAAAEGANAAGLRFRTLRHWEQLTAFTIFDDGRFDIRVDGIAPEQFSLICVSGQPAFAVPPSDEESRCEFMQAEWTASLNTWFRFGRRPLLNGLALSASADFRSSGIALIAQLARCGWQRARDSEQASRWLLLSGWRTWQMNGSGESEQVALDGSVLARTHRLLSRLEIDFLVLKLCEQSNGVAVAGAYLAPPTEAPISVWTAIWRELSL